MSIFISERHLSAAQTWARESGIENAEIAVPSLAQRVKAGWHAGAAHLDAENEVRSLEVTDRTSGKKHLINVSYYAKDNTGENRYVTNDFAKAPTIVGAIPLIGALFQGFYGLMSTLVGLNTILGNHLGLHDQPRGEILFKSGVKNTAAVAASLAAYVTLGFAGVAVDAAVRTAVVVMDERDQKRLETTEPVTLVEST